MNGAKVIYVAGYSRCGSTVLSMLLGSHPDICSVGEICFLPDDWSLPSRVCSCGAPYPECAFWRGLDAKVQFSHQLIPLVRRFEGRRAFAQMCDDPSAHENAVDYGAAVSAILDHARQASGASIILDSSKSARDAAARPLALSRLAGQDVAVIHLVRDGYSTVDSYKRQGSNWVKEGYRKKAPFQTYRAMVGWRLANEYACRLGAQLGEHNYLQIRYRDLVTEPARSLNQIGAFAGLDLSSVITRIENSEPLDSAHQVGGNRVRFEEPRFRRSEEAMTPSNLLSHEKLAFRMLAGQPERRF